MIAEDFKINFKNKKISLRPKGGRGDHTVRELYSLLMDLLDEPENMKYDIPIEAKSKTEYLLVNGWTIDEKARKRLKGNLGSRE